MRKLLFALVVNAALFVSMQAYFVSVIHGTAMTVVCTLVCIYTYELTQQTHKRKSKR